MQENSDEDFCCNLCFEKFDEVERKPMSYSGCGHSCCAQCFNGLKAVGKNVCPECNRAYDDCHPNYELIRVMRRLTNRTARPSPSSSSKAAVVLPPPPPPPPSVSQLSSSDLRLPLCSFCRETEVAFYCKDCTANKLLCGDCCEMKHSKAAMTSHAPAPYTTSDAPITCQVPTHESQECLMYCRGCKGAICTLCSYDGHMGHDMCILSDEATACKARLAEAIRELEEKARTIQLANAEVSGVSESLFGVHPLAGVGGGKGQAQTRAQALGGLQGSAIRDIQTHCEALREQSIQEMDLAMQDLQQQEVELIKEVQSACAAEGALLETQMDDLSAVVGRSYSLAYSVKQERQRRAEGSILASLVSDKEMLRRVEAETQSIQGVIRTAPISLAQVQFIPTTPLPPRHNKGVAIGNSCSLPSSPIMLSKMPEFYWNNTDLPLVIKTSQIHNSGNGVWTNTFIPKGTRIGYYEGRVLCGDDQITDYSFTLNKKWFVDAFQFPRSIIAMINDVYCSRFKTNCEFDVQTRDLDTGELLQGQHRRVFLASTKDIPKGSELFASYGDEYWDCKQREVKNNSHIGNIFSVEASHSKPLTRYNLPKPKKKLLKNPK
jgi:uncharacterized protein